MENILKALNLRRWSLIYFAWVSFIVSVATMDYDTMKNEGENAIELNRLQEPQETKINPEEKNYCFPYALGCITRPVSHKKFLDFWMNGLMVCSLCAASPTLISCPFLLYDCCTGIFSIRNAYPCFGMKVFGLSAVCPAFASSPPMLYHFWEENFSNDLACCCCSAEGLQCLILSSALFAIWACPVVTCYVTDALHQIDCCDSDGNYMRSYRKGQAFCCSPENPLCSC